MKFVVKSNSPISIAKTLMKLLSRVPKVGDLGSSMWKTAQKERKRTAKAEKNLKTERVTLDIMTTLIPID